MVIRIETTSIGKNFNIFDIIYLSIINTRLSDEMK